MSVKLILIIILIAIIAVVFAWWLAKRSGWKPPISGKKVWLLLLGIYGALSFLDGFTSALGDYHWRPHTLGKVIIGVICLVLAIFFWRRGSSKAQAVPPLKGGCTETLKPPNDP
jgi:hypothetical protein